MFYKEKLIAHRGLAEFAPENTIQAFINSGKKGCRAVECDIHLSKDGEFVILHDFTLERMTGDKRFVRDVTVQEIKNLNVISGKHLEDYTEVKIPLLKELLQVCEYYEMVPVIEIKDLPDYNHLDRLIALLSDTGLFAKTVIISFELSYLIYLRNKYPELKIQLLTEEADANSIAICKSHHFDIDIFYENVTKSFIDSCHQNGILVNVWTVDDEHKAEALFDAGVDFITSNRLY